MKKYLILISILILLMAISFFYFRIKPKTISETSTIPKADLVITDVKKINGSDYLVSIKNIGDADVTDFYYVCMWDALYKPKVDGKCNWSKIVNYDSSTQKPTILNAGLTQTVTFQGIFGLPPNDNKLFLVVDKSDNPKINNLIDELDENNNNYTYTII